LTRICLKCPHGTNVHDHAAAARLHALCCRLRCEELALEDRIQEPVVLFLGHIGEGDRLKDARVINENVYAAEFPFRRLDQREAGRRFRDIATEDSHAIRLSEPGGCCAQLRFIPAVQQNSGAFGVQALGRLEADT
jgi:hypothetical protein